MSTPELIYVGDPLCSWCWGFQPSWRKLRLSHPARFRYSLLVGGLRTGASALPLDDRLRAYLADAWREVGKRSGQPFDYGFLAGAEFVYDTEPACRAVVAARLIAPERVFDYNESLQDAFYRRGLDPTDRSTFLTVAREQGLSEDELDVALSSVDVERETRRDFERTRSLGVHGFPTVILHANGAHETIARGWLPPEAFIEKLQPWL